ncbi:MAG: helix-turn-helix transcriptional regulator [Bacillota bacterium]
MENIQKDFSLKVGVSRQTIVAIEKGQYSPTLELCFKLALVFDKPIDDIFYTDSKEKKE